MGWKSKLIEFPVWLAGRFARSEKHMPQEPSSIFVLRSTDIGDLLVTTPVFQALRERFPNSRIVAGIGDWNREILENNPYVDEVMPVNMPRYNKFVKPQRTRDLLEYLWSSDEVQAIAARRFDIGIDILGSYAGSALMLRAKIPYRLGVKGLIGGYSATQQHITFDLWEHVGRAALRFAELLGAENLPECRPQIFLTDGEREAGLQQWNPRQSAYEHTAKRLVIGPGGGFPEKCWPVEHFRELLERMVEHQSWEVIIVGGKQDHEAGEKLAQVTARAQNLAGELSLRETFGVVAAADMALCNSSMLMHVAAAFHKDTYVFLGEHFPSAALHQAQWGYPDTCRVLGRDEDHPAIYTPQEGFECITRQLSDSREASDLVSQK